MVKKYSIWIEKTKTGKYKFCQRYVDPLRSTEDKTVYGKVTVTLTKKTAQAKNEARAILAKKIDKKLAAQSKGTDITLQELTDKYQAYLKETDSPWNTRKRAEGNFKFINEYFKGAVAKNVTTPMVNTYLEYCLYKRPRKLSNSSTRLRKYYLSSAYRYGQRHGLVSVNPVKGIQIPYKDESNKERDRIENKYFTDEELRALLGYVKYVADRSDYYYLFKWMAVTGMRVSEAAGIQMHNIIKKDGIWYAQVVGNQEYHYGKMYKDDNEKKHSVKSNRTKTTTSKRNVQLSSDAMKIVKINSEFRGSQDHLFMNNRSHNTWNTFTVDDYMKVIARKLGINKKLTSHFFRHTLISKLTEIGMPLAAIMKQVGQKDSKVTRQIYTHVTEKERFKLQSGLDILDNDINI